MRTVANKHKHVDRALPRPGDPLVLPTGEIIYEETFVKPYDPDESVGLTTSPRDFRPLAKRVVKDFPANLGMFKAISVVFSMTMYGIGNLEICDVLGISLADLEEVRRHQGYTDLFNAVFNEFINANSDMLQSRIAAYSRAAVKQVGHLVDNAKKEETRLSASKDILDRAGMRPQDLQNSAQMSMNELQIRITKKSDDVTVDVHVGRKDGVENG